MLETIPIVLHCIRDLFEFSAVGSFSSHAENMKKSCSTVIHGLSDNASVIFFRYRHYTTWNNATIFSALLASTNSKGCRRAKPL